MFRTITIKKGVLVNKCSSARHRLAEVSNDYLCQIPDGFNTERLAIVTNDGIFTNVQVDTAFDNGSLKWFSIDGKPELLVHLDYDRR